MTANGEWKALWGMTLIAAVYGIYMTCSEEPTDGLVLSGIVGAIVAIVTGIGVKRYVECRALFPRRDS